MGKEKIFISFLVFLVLVGTVFLGVRFFHALTVPLQDSRVTEETPSQDAASDPDSFLQGEELSQKDSSETGKNFSPPLPRSSERVTKKPFGIFIAPEDSPVSPERFRGYHAGADFEIFPEELDSDVVVSAICDGKIILKRHASGYGGVVVESCILDDAPATVIYGHLSLASIAASAGDEISAGEKIGILGKDKSSETDGERKHLHLGIHKGPEVNILGYVQNEEALTRWIDPCSYFCGK